MVSGVFREAAGEGLLLTSIEVVHGSLTRVGVATPFNVGVILIRGKSSGLDSVAESFYIS